MLLVFKSITKLVCICFQSDTKYNTVQQYNPYVQTHRRLYLFFIFYNLQTYMVAISV